MKYMKKFFKLLQKNKDFIGKYPATAVEMMIDLFTVSDMSKKDIRNKLIKKFFQKINVFKFAIDMIKAGWAVL